MKTAANSSLLKAVRNLMNDAIYRTFRSILNADGEAAALDYLSRFFTPEGWDRVSAELTKEPR